MKVRCFVCGGWIEIVEGDTLEETRWVAHPQHAMPKNDSQRPIGVNFPPKVEDPPPITKER